MNILLRARYVATDLVTSQNSQPIRCAIRLRHFGRTRAVGHVDKWPPESFSSVALRKAVLQAAT